MKTGIIIATARKNHGLSQEALAEQANLSARTIQRIGKDLVKPRPHTLKLIAEVLHLEIEALQAKPVPVPAIQQSTWQGLRILNFLVLPFTFFPSLNIFVPFWWWQRQEWEVEQKTLAKKILIIQTLWTLAFFTLLMFVPMLTFLISGQKMIGQFPMPILIYIVWVLGNIGFTLRLAFQLAKEKDQFLQKIPLLF